MAATARVRGFCSRFSLIWLRMRWVLQSFFADMAAYEVPYGLGAVLISLPGDKAVEGGKQLSVQRYAYTLDSVHLGSPACIGTVIFEFKRPRSSIF